MRREIDGTSSRDRQPRKQTQRTISLDDHHHNNKPHRVECHPMCRGGRAGNGRSALAASTWAEKNSETSASSAMLVMAMAMVEREKKRQQKR